MNPVRQVCALLNEHERTTAPEGERAISGASRLAQLCDVSHAAVQKWRAAGVVPPKKVLLVWRYCVSAGIAITPYDLNPDVFLLDGRVPAWPDAPVLVNVGLRAGRITANQGESMQPAAS